MEASAEAQIPPRLKERYESEIRDRLKQRFEYSSTMEVPRLEKITLNMGVGEAKQDSRMLEQATEQLATIAGQRMVSSVGLVKALGGGWDASDMARETGDVAAPAPVPASGAAASAATAPSAAAPLAQK